MGRNLEPRCKQCRRMGEKLMLRGERCLSSKCAILKRNFPPGMHGSTTGRSRITSFGLQMKEKQKAKKIYGILEKQFKKYAKESIRKAGNTALHLIHALELRLDNVVYRAGFASSRRRSRQLISHKHFKVNGHGTNVASYRLRVGDKITVRENSLKNKYFTELLASNKKIEAPAWMKVDPKNLVIEIIEVPRLEDTREHLETSLIIEFYAR